MKISADVLTGLDWSHINAEVDAERKTEPAAMYLAGRCANGSELDSGTLWHALQNLETSRTAMCGARPGRRSAGWRGYPDEIHAVTCKRCLAKMYPTQSVM